MTRLVFGAVTLAFAGMLAFMLAQVPASAQTGAGSDKKAKAVLQEKDEAAAYKAATERIPDSADKYDPWGIVRGTPEPAAAKKKK